MNIYAEEGSKVVYTGQGGYAIHKEIADRHLKIGDIYEVKRTKISSWHTSVILKGFEGVRFNSVMFEDVGEL